MVVGKSSLSDTSADQSTNSDNSNSNDKRYIRTLLVQQQRLYRRIRRLEAIVGEKNKIIHKWTARCSRMQKKS